MKIAAINNSTNFQHKLIMPSKATNLLYSAILSTSLLSLATDAFTKSEAPIATKTEQVVPQQAQLTRVGKDVNKSLKQKDGSAVGHIIAIAAAATIGLLIRKSQED